MRCALVASGIFLTVACGLTQAAERKSEVAVSPAWPVIPETGLALSDVSGPTKKDLPHFVIREWMAMGGGALELNILYWPWFREEDVLGQARQLVNHAECDKRATSQACRLAMVVEIRVVGIGPGKDYARYCYMVAVSAVPGQNEEQVRESYMIPERGRACVVPPSGSRPGRPFPLELSALDFSAKR